MSSFALAPILQALAPDAAAIVPALIVLLSGGLVGMSIKNMFDSIMSDDESDEADGGGGGGGGLMGDDGGGGGDDGDELGGLGGLEDDDDDMGGFGDDEFGDMEDATGPDTDELEHRIDELESEMGSLSSTVNTVRTENESISESVDEVQENVRKLLDIYEMVTRGVNPFADDVDAGMGGGMDGDGSFGLFDNDDGGDDSEDIDDDVANADAEGFFDEDLVADDGGEETSMDGDDMFDDGFDDDGDFDDGGGFDDGDFDDGGGFDDGGDFDDDFDSGDDMSMDDGVDTDDDGDDDGDGGKSFAELKNEYESGDAEWAEGEEPEADDGGDEMLEDDVGDADDMLADDGDEMLEDDGFDDGGDGLEDDDLFDEVIEDDGTAGAEADGGAMEMDDPEPEPAVEPEPEPAVEPEPEPEPAADGDDGKPYLSSVPEGFAEDLIVIEWLEFLVEQAGYRETSRAIDYYETIGWIDESVAEALADYLRGFDDVDDTGSGLTIDHHTESLRYISQLDEDSGADGVMLSKLVGGGSDGLQR